MSFGRAALAAFVAGSFAAALMLLLVLQTPAPADQAAKTLPRFVVLVSPASARLLADSTVSTRLELIVPASSDGLPRELERLAADGIILDRSTITEMSSAGVGALLRSGRVIVTIGVDAQEVQFLAGLVEPRPTHVWPRPYFSILLYSDRTSRGTSMDYSTATFTGLLTMRAKQASQERGVRSATATPAP